MPAAAREPAPARRRLGRGSDETVHATVFDHHPAAHRRRLFPGCPGDKIRDLLRGRAFDGTGRLRRPKALSINKIGHADARSRSGLFSDFSRIVSPEDPGVGSVGEPPLLQSMYTGSRVSAAKKRYFWHQDLTIL